MAKSDFPLVNADGKQSTSPVPHPALNVLDKQIFFYCSFSFLLSNHIPFTLSFSVGEYCPTYLLLHFSLETTQSYDFINSVVGTLVHKAA